MRATYECENCFNEYDHEDEFVQCHGDACHELVCITNCAKKCKDTTCKHHVCQQCRDSYSDYMGEYCIDCAMWDDTEEDGMVNFDYVAKGMTHDQGLAYLKGKDK